jgi:hypothetical protein
MSYNKEKMLELALNVIINNNCVFITDVVSFLPCTRDTFYNLGLNKSDKLKDAIYKNKTIIKQKIREDWGNSKDFNKQIALYKLCANQEEHQLLSQKYIDHTSKGEEIGRQHIDSKEFIKVLDDVAARIASSDKDEAGLA